MKAVFRGSLDNAAEKPAHSCSVNVVVVSYSIKFSMFLSLRRQYEFRPHQIILLRYYNSNEVNFASIF